MPLHPPDQPRDDIGQFLPVMRMHHHARLDILLPYAIAQAQKHVHPHDRPGVDVGHVGAHLATLRRVTSGKWDVADALTLDAILALKPGELEKRVIPFLQLAR